MSLESRMLGFLGIGGALSALVFALVNRAGAATYQFYFNNTEQGDHSTANPSVRVDADSTAPVSGASPLPAQAAVDSSSQPVASPVPGAPLASGAADSAPTESTTEGSGPMGVPTAENAAASHLAPPEREPSKWAFSVGGTYALERKPVATWEWQAESWDYGWSNEVVDQESVGVSLAAAYSWKPYLAGDLRFGLERPQERKRWLPQGSGMLVLKTPEPLDLGRLPRLVSLGAGAGLWLFLVPGTVMSYPVRPALEARLGLHLGLSWRIESSIRMALLTDKPTGDTRHLAMGGGYIARWGAESGLVFDL